MSQVKVYTQLPWRGPGAHHPGSHSEGSGLRWELWEAGEAHHWLQSDWPFSHAVPKVSTLLVPQSGTHVSHLCQRSCFFYPDTRLASYFLHFSFTLWMHLSFLLHHLCGHFLTSSRLSSEWLALLLRCSQHRALVTMGTSSVRLSMKPCKTSYLFLNPLSALPCGLGSIWPTINSPRILYKSIRCDSELTENLIRLRA